MQSTQTARPTQGTTVTGQTGRVRTYAFRGSARDETPGASGAAPAVQPSMERCTSEAERAGQGCVFVTCFFFTSFSELRPPWELRSTVQRFHVRSNLKGLLCMA